MEKGAIDLTVTLDLERYKAWRRVVVPGDATFVQLHKIIQCVFSWQDRHPYPVSYTHLDVYKRQIVYLPHDDCTRRRLPKKSKSSWNKGFRRDLPALSFV